MFIVLNIDVINESPKQMVITLYKTSKHKITI